MIEIDEIISNTEYCADVYERMDKAIHPALQVSDYKRHAEDHRRLAEWLKDYKRLKEREPCEDAISRAYIEPVIEELENICYNAPQEVFRIYNAIKDGMLLPEGHGRLIDADELRCEREDFDTYSDYSNAFWWRFKRFWII